MDKLRAMQIFSRVVEARSFAGAARSLSLPRSTVSRSIQDLEAALGASLLQRTTRTLRLTPNGSLYYDHCQRILREIDSIEGILSDSALTPRGLLRVDMTASFARALVIPALRDFHARHPGIDLSLTLDDRPVELIQEGVDCAVRAGRLDPTSLLVARRIGAFDWITCAAPDYLQRHPAPRTPDELARHDVVGFQSGRTGRANGWTFHVDGRPRTVDPTPRLTVNETDAYLGCGLEGLGLIRIASYLAAPHLRAGRLVRVLAAYQDAPVPLSLVYPQNRHLSSAVRTFADWLGDLYSAREPDWERAGWVRDSGEPGPRAQGAANMAP